MNRALEIIVILQNLFQLSSIMFNFLRSVKKAYFIISKIQQFTHIKRYRAKTLLHEYLCCENGLKFSFDVITNWQ